jgi:hypothetical protein
MVAERLPVALLEQLKVTGADDEDTVEFILKSVEAALENEDRQECLQDVADLLEAYEAAHLAGSVVNWCEKNAASPSEHDSRNGAMEQVLRLVAVDGAVQVGAQVRGSAVDDCQKAAVLRAARDLYEDESLAQDELGEGKNENRQAVADILAKTRAESARQHAEKVARDKADLAADKARKAEAKKKAQDRSKKNEARRGGRGM